MLMWKIVNRSLHTGTANVIRACVKQNVSRLIYTSTIDAVIDKSWRAYDDAVESEPYPRNHLYGGYGGTKCRAEQLVLAANDTQLKGEALPQSCYKSRMKPTKMSYFYRVQVPYFGMDHGNFQYYI